MFGRALIALLLLTSAAGCSRRDYRLGDIRLHLPPEAVVQGMPQWLRSLPGLDDGSREMTILLPADYVAKHVPGYVVQDGQVRQDVVIFLTALEPEELEHSRHDLLVQQMAKKNGAFEGRQAVYDHIDHAWHVSAFGAPGMFALMRINPDLTNDLDMLQANWLGYCTPEDMAATETGKSWSCDSNVVVGHLSAGFHYGPKNLKNYRALAAFVRRSQAEWMADAR